MGHNLILIYLFICVYLNLDMWLKYFYNKKIIRMDIFFLLVLNAAQYMSSR